jgi:uncharacterized protein (DUF1697 family)
VSPDLVQSTFVALVVLLRGVNVGGHRRFRPTTLAAALRHLDAVNIGAAGTLVIRRPVARLRLRAELARIVPFAAEIVICAGRDFAAMASRDPFADRRVPSGAVRFVSVLSRRPRLQPRLPMRFPAGGPWLLRILARDGRFVFGLYRRHMKVIGYLGALDRLFGVPATTRSWSTVTAIARVLQGPSSRRPRPAPARG